VEAVVLSTASDPRASAAYASKVMYNFFYVLLLELKKVLNLIKASELFECNKQFSLLF